MQNSTKFQTVIDNRPILLQYAFFCTFSGIIFQHFNNLHGEWLINRIDPIKNYLGNIVILEDDETENNISDQQN